MFAPGRIKEHFHLDMNGNELTVSYTPPEGFPRPEWVLREYSRGGLGIRRCRASAGGMTVEKVQESEEIYLVAAVSDANVKIRD